MMRVVHKRRNISTGKEVFPGGKPGQYEIMIMFHNNSDSALDDLAMHDIVPGHLQLRGQPSVQTKMAKGMLPRLRNRQEMVLKSHGP